MSHTYMYFIFLKLEGSAGREPGGKKKTKEETENMSGHKFHGSLIRN